jgi:CubicO group peptidase (beta-lactamase class C family)
MKSLFFSVGLFFISTVVLGQNLYFPPIVGNEWETIDPATLNWCETGNKALDDFLIEKGSKGFIILKDGKIVKETYFDNFTKDSVWYWASAGKSITSFMVGMAQEKGLLNINDKTSKYLGEGWTSLSPEQENKITIWHQLTMTSGLDDSGDDLDCMMPECLTYKADAGQRWAYHNAPYRLLHNVMAEAWGNTYQNFMNTQLTVKTGIGGLWLDGVLYSKPRNMARFGLLTLNKGTWNGQQILEDQTYVNAMSVPSQMINKSYGLLWWLNGQESFMLPGIQLAINRFLIPNAPADMYCALGKNDQKIYIVPSQNLVVVRVGNAAEEIAGAISSFDNQLWEKINGLTCTTSTNESSNINFQIYPNPFFEQIEIIGDEIFIDADLTIYNVQGSLVYQEKFKKDSLTNLLKGLSSGVYFLHFKNRKGVSTTKKIVKY